MKIKETNINTSGLMCCCLKTLYKYIEDHKDEKAKDGIIVTCEFNDNSRMILSNNTWRWLKENE